MELSLIDEFLIYLNLMSYEGRAISLPLGLQRLPQLFVVDTYHFQILYTVIGHILIMEIGRLLNEENLRLLHKTFDLHEGVFPFYDLTRGIQTTV